jgi:hypothetical protein
MKMRIVVDDAQRLLAHEDDEDDHAPLAVATDCRPGRAELEADGGGVRDVKAVVAPAGKDLLDLHPGGLSHERLPVLEPVSDDPAVPQ